MEIKSEAKYIRVTPQKMRLIAHAVRRLPLEKALTFLSTVNKRAALPLAKAIKSGIANAEQNHKVLRGQLRLKELMVDEGPTFKRWRAASRGMAHRYEKKTSHITVILDSNDPSLAASDAASAGKQKSKARLTVRQGVNEQKKTPEKVQESKQVAKVPAQQKKGYQETIEQRGQTPVKSQQYQKKGLITRKVIGG